MSGFISRVAPKSRALCLVLALSVVGCASSAPSSSIGSVNDVTGTWEGSWRGNGRMGACTLILTQAGTAVAGTIQCTDAGSFGAAPQPIREGQLVGKQLVFSATGQDGGVFKADFSVNAGKIDGWGRYTGPGYDGNYYHMYTRRHM